jgi:hypothetical protein
MGRSWSLSPELGWQEDGYPMDARSRLDLTGFPDAF